MKRSFNNRYRAGPWPGLTPSGAGILLACAVFLAIGQILVGVPQRPIPDLPVVGATALLPLALAVRIVGIPGAASATCGAYLLPRSLLGLLVPTLGQPPLLLVPVVVFDVVLWWLDTRLPPRLRSMAAGALFGTVLALVEAPFRQFLGEAATTWSGPLVWLAAAATAIVCAATATVLNVRGTAS